MTDLPSIGNPATSALALAGVTDLEAVTGWTRRDVLALHGVGPKAIRILEEALTERGLTFAGESSAD